MYDPAVNPGKLKFPNASATTVAVAAPLIVTVAPFPPAPAMLPLTAEVVGAAPAIGNTSTMLRL